MSSHTLSHQLSEIHLRWRAYPLLRSQTLWAAIIHVVVLAVVYSDVVFEGRTFLMGPTTPGVTSDGPYGYDRSADVEILTGDRGAIAWAMEPWSFYINQLFKQGELPLWNPHQGLGTPLLGSAQPAPFDPILLITHLAPQSLWPVAVDLHLLVRYFLAGFFTYLFLRSTGVGFAGAIAGGITFMLCGYLMFYGNISYVRADALLPMLMFTYDRLAVKPTRRTLLFSIGALWLIIATGFPETLPLHIGLASLWYLFRTGLLARAGRWSVQTIARRVGWLAVSGVFAVLLAAFILGPFIETAMHAEHIHYHGSPDPEMTYSRAFIPTLLALFLPSETSIAYIPNIFSLGFIPLVLGLYAALWAVSAGKKRATLEAATLFFFALFLALILIAFRGPLLGWVPDLPGISAIIMWKYPQALIAFCLAYSVGAGVAFWQRDQHRFTRVVSAIALLTVLLMVLMGHWITEGDEYDSRAPFGTIALLLATLTLFTAAYNVRPAYKNVMVYAAIALLVIEPLLWFGYLQRPVRYFAYEEPPYLNVLRASDEEFRVIGLDRELYPNTASVFDIDDVRYLDALHPQSYLDFARRFVITPNIRRRFTGIEPVIQFNRGLNFLNVEYVIADSREDTFSRHLSGIEFEDDYDTIPLTIGERTGRALEVGATNPLPVTLRIPTSQRAVLDLGFGIDPAALDCDCLESGVTFSASVNTQNGPLFLMERLVDPVHNEADRDWQTERIELTRWAGQTVRLNLSTSTPTGGDLRYARWMSPEMLSAGYAFPWLEDAAAEAPVLSVARWMPFPLASLNVNGDTRLAVRQHPPSEAVVALSVPDGESRLDFGITLDTRLWTDEFASLPLGDGVTFRIGLDDGSSEQALFEQYIDPKNIPQQRRWLNASVDLSPWAGQRVDLIFSTDGGPAGDTTFDWAFWSDMRFTSTSVEPTLSLVSDETQFATVYDDGETAVYRNELVYPRAFVVRNAEVVDSTQAALDRFGEPDFNPTNAVVLTGPLPDRLTSQLETLPSELLAEPVDVVEERANSMRLEADLSAPGVLVVSELDYPGWHAWVDGEEQPILQANGVARALYLNAGHHVIEFTYVPLPFWIGVAVSLGALALLAAGLVLWGRRERRAMAAENGLSVPANDK